MKRNDSKTNELLAQVVERFLYHSQYVHSDKPITKDMAQKMCEIEIWEMWTLTQK